MYREYGWAPRGEQITAVVSGKKFQRLNIVSAKMGKKIVAPFVYDGTTDSALFECWFEKCLLKELPENAVIIMDNASFHRKAKLQELVQGTTHRIIFLPPYSPDLNPIEHFWAWLKNEVRNILPKCDCLMDALMLCF